VITGLWDVPDGGTFSFSGTYYTVVDSPALPKPVQRPRPPVIVGGIGPTRTPRLAARFADEYNVPFASVEDTAAAFGRVREACAAAGRHETSMIYSAAQTVAVGRTQAELDRRAAAIGRKADELANSGIAGLPDDVVKKIRKFAEIGADARQVPRPAAGSAAAQRQRPASGQQAMPRFRDAERDASGAVARDRPVRAGLGEPRGVAGWHGQDGAGGRLGAGRGLGGHARSRDVGCR
jgi:alkanesulfonate monooxygenase SsuD/methylene tetrahydromethanopterin reductase-like flavin-dependent oxidoreductase (luciferase family)